MFDEKDLAVVTPTLTLNPIVEEVKEKPQLPSVEDIKKAMPSIEEEMNKSGLNEVEKKQVEDFAKQIDLRNSTVILQYGAGTQQKMAGFSEKALENVKSKDLGQVGDMLADVVKELKGFEKEEEKGFLGFFKKAGNRLETLKLRYDKAEVNVNRIVTSLEQHQVTLLKDISTLDQMYGMNLSYYKELTMYILAGKMKIKELKETELAQLQKKAEESNLPEDAQEANDLKALIDRFEKKIHDLELTRMVSIQTAPQIRLIQNNDTVMAEKIQSTIVNTIPLWKSQMVLALGIEHSNEAAKAQQQVTDMTNELLKKNAETLKMATVKTAQISERGIIDMDTLRQTNESLISTLDEVQAIQKEGRLKRAEAEVELQKLESDLKNRLLEMNKNK
ncbi:MAG TPA: toxic anion resistance protein [Lachnospiraceae bacterium]